MKTIYVVKAHKEGSPSEIVRAFSMEAEANAFISLAVECVREQVLMRKEKMDVFREYRYSRIKKSFDGCYAVEEKERQLQEHHKNILQYEISTDVCAFTKESVELY